MAEPDPLVVAVNIIANVVRSVHLKRALSEIDPEPRLNFWRGIYGNLLDIAVIDWCKLFGSDDEEHQKTHWKNVIAGPEHASFRQELYHALATDKDGCAAYWKEMKDYRDRHAVHRDFKKNDITHYPVLDGALASCRVYYRHVIVKLRANGVNRYPEDLDAYGEAFADQAREIARAALAATNAFEERVF